MPQKRKPIDWEKVKSVAAEVADTEALPSRIKVAQRLGMPAPTLSARARSEGMDAEIDAILAGGAPAPAGVISAANDPTPAPWKAEDVIRAHGDDPEKVVILRQRGNRWGTPEGPNHQLRVDWIRKDEALALPDPGKWTPPPKPKKPDKRGERRVVLCGDHHAPLHDKTLHACFLEYLAATRPPEGIILGDLMDFATVSRFREREGFAHPVNECLQSAFEILRDYREASPDTEWTMLPGNHDARLHYALLDNVRELHKVMAADEEIPALDFRRLLHLDELGIAFVDGDWESAKISLCRNLTVRHGYTVAKNAGDKMLNSLTRSTVQGHSHRLSFTYRTDHDDDVDEPTTTRVAVEAGCMAEIADGLGHAIDPNWQAGFVEASIWPDGRFHLSPWVYVPGALLGPGRRFTA